MGATPEIAEDRLVWIMGSSRSGSTWLLRMLCELEGATGVDDPHIGHHLGPWRPIPLAWATAEETPELTTLAEVKRGKDGYFFNDRYADTWRPLLRELIIGRFAAQAEDRRGPVFVKEPGAQAAGLLLSLFPESRLVFLLRDGRDVVDSWLAAYRKGSWAQEEGAFPLAAEGRETFIRWQAGVWAYRTNAVSRAYEAHDPERRVLVRYEDLLADPVAELRRICPVAGVTNGVDELARIAAAHDFEVVPKDGKGADQPARSAHPGGWRENLSESEQRVLMEELGETLARCGYGAPPRPSLAAA